MTVADRINQFDAWLLDRVFQPALDRLPERPFGFDIGLSLQLGAVVLSAAAIVALIATGVIGVFTGFTNVLIWLFGVVFYVGNSRMRPLIRPGHANPLRLMLQGMRPLSIPFLGYSVWIMATAPPIMTMALRFNALADLLYVVGLYVISCQPKPPAFRRTVVDWTPRPVRQA